MVGSNRKRSKIALASWAILVGAAVAGSASAQQAELHTFHCLHGCPVGSPATNDIIVREIYTLSSNDMTKIADWVAYRITKATIGPSAHRGAGTGCGILGWMKRKHMDLMLIKELAMLCTSTEDIRFR